MPPRQMIKFEFARAALSVLALAQIITSLSLIRTDPVYSMLDIGLEVLTLLALRFHWTWMFLLSFSLCVFQGIMSLWAKEWGGLIVPFLCYIFWLNYSYSSAIKNGEVVRKRFAYFKNEQGQIVWLRCFSILILGFYFIWFFYPGAEHVSLVSEQGTCQKDPRYCFNEALELQRVGKLDEAISLYKRGCLEAADKEACTNASSAINQHAQDSQGALVMAVRGCDLGDAKGCYNVACNQCRLGKPDLALEYLKKTFELGYRNFDHIASDTDLDCVKAGPGFQTLIKIYKP